MKIWSKTILSVYKYLEALSNALDNLILKKSVNSMFYSNGRYNTTYDCANEIIILTERKVNLINLKVLVEKGLSKLTLEDRKLLTLCYVDGVRGDKISQLMGCCDRTFYRKKNDAIASFSKAIGMEGYNKIKLEEMFGKEKWLKDLYDKNNITDTLQCLDKSNKDYNFFKKVIKELSNVNYQSSYGF